MPAVSEKVEEIIEEVVEEVDVHVRFVRGYVAIFAFLFVFVSVFYSTQVSAQNSGVDSDGDGWSDVEENRLGTDPNAACSTNSSHAAWPPDFNNDKKLDIADKDLFLTPIKIFGTKRGDANYRERFNLNNGDSSRDVINILDISAFLVPIQTGNTTCSVVEPTPTPYPYPSPSPSPSPISPPGQEICGDGIDNDQDGQIDEGCAVPGEVDLIIVNKNGSSSPEISVSDGGKDIPVVGGKATVNVNQYVVFEARTKNIGTRTSNESTTRFIAAGATPFQKNLAVGNLSSGQSTAHGVVVKWTSPGTNKVVGFIADSYATNLQESNESNNTNSIIVDVVGTTSTSCSGNLSFKLSAGSGSQVADGSGEKLSVQAGAPIGFFATGMSGCDGKTVRLDYAPPGGNWSQLEDCRYYNGECVAQFNTPVKSGLYTTIARLLSDSGKVEKEASYQVWLELIAATPSDDVGTPPGGGVVANPGSDGVKTYIRWYVACKYQNKCDPSTLGPNDGKGVHAILGYCVNYSCTVKDTWEVEDLGGWLYGISKRESGHYPFKVRGDYGAPPDNPNTWICHFEVGLFQYMHGPNIGAHPVTHTSVKRSDDVFNQFGELIDGGCGGYQIWEGAVNSPSCPDRGTNIWSYQDQIRVTECKIRADGGLDVDAWSDGTSNWKNAWKNYLDSW